MCLVLSELAAFLYSGEAGTWFIYSSLLSLWDRKHVRERVYPLNLPRFLSSLSAPTAGATARDGKREAGTGAALSEPLLGMLRPGPEGPGQGAEDRVWFSYGFRFGFRRAPTT